jgi:hypothetical protein
MKLRTPADSSRGAHGYDREFGTSRAGSAPSTLHDPCVAILEGFKAIYKVAIIQVFSELVREATARF